MVVRQDDRRLPLAALGGPLQPGQILDRRPALGRQAPQLQLRRQEARFGRPTQPPDRLGGDVPGPVRRRKNALEFPVRQHGRGGGAARPGRHFVIRPRPPRIVDRAGVHLLADQPGGRGQALVGRGRQPAVGRRRIDNRPRP